MTNARETDGVHCGKFCPWLERRKSSTPACTKYSKPLHKDYFDFERRVHRCDECNNSPLTEDREFLAEG